MAENEVKLVSESNEQLSYPRKSLPVPPMSYFFKKNRYSAVWDNICRLQYGTGVGTLFYNTPNSKRYFRI